MDQTAHNRRRPNDEARETGVHGRGDSERELLERRKPRGCELRALAPDHDRTVGNLMTIRIV